MNENVLSEQLSVRFSWASVLPSLDAYREHLLVGVHGLRWTLLVIELWVAIGTYCAHGWYSQRVTLG